MDELQFRQWLQNNRVPFDPNAQVSDYDMRGYYQGLQQQNPHAAPSEVNPNDNQLHYPDYYKTPLHESFSNQSKFATPNSPHWMGQQNQDRLVDPQGNVVFDEKFLKFLRGER